METEKEVAQTSRRSFLDVLGAAFLSLWGVAFFGVIYAYLGAPRRRENESGGTLRAGSLARIPIGDAIVVQHESGPVLVARIAEEEVLAFSALCTHVKCVLRWNRENHTILCPCHGGAFDASGNVLYGPPPRPLPKYSAEVRDAQIFIRLT